MLWKNCKNEVLWPTGWTRAEQLVPTFKGILRYDRYNCARRAIPQVKNVWLWQRLNAPHFHVDPTPSESSRYDQVKYPGWPQTDDKFWCEFATSLCINFRKLSGTSIFIASVQRESFAQKISVSRAMWFSLAQSGWHQSPGGISLQK